mmetsp:Transcript_5858/g.21387  ORF Transcript_5858/g.21387 Transcript_5858/m.21387 type:complete len:367 (-) Transcript_5858:1286-2386(-)
MSEISCVCGSYGEGACVVQAGQHCVGLSEGRHRLYRGGHGRPASLVARVRFSWYRARSPHLVACGSRGSQLPKDVVGAIRGTQCDSQAKRQLFTLAERAVSASNRWDVSYSDFLSPASALQAERVLAGLAGTIGTLRIGGYPYAERVRLAMGHPELIGILSLKYAPKLEGEAVHSDETGKGERSEAEELLDDAIAVARVEGDFRYTQPTHRDFLGAVLGLGINRTKVGDIILLDGGREGAQVVCDPRVLGLVEAELSRIRNVPVRVQRILPSQMKITPPTFKTIRAVKSSARLDAIVAAGFGLSRTKASDCIRRGSVSVNWAPASKDSAQMDVGDTVSVRGLGRIKIARLVETSKGKIACEILRYL